MIKPPYPRVLVLCGLLLCGCAADVATRGRHMVDQGQYEGAIELLTELVVSEPQNAEGWRELGFAYYKSGDLPKAEKALDRASQTDPRTHLIRGLVFEKLEQWDNAISSYLVALTHGPPRKTEKLLNSRVDILVHRQLEHAVARAIAQEDAIDVDTIPSNTVAVFNFDASALPPETAPLAMGLAELTSNDLAKVKSLQVVERLKLDMILKELQLTSSGVTDPSSAARVGRLVGSRRLVTGALLTYDDKIRVNGAIVSTPDASSTTTESSVEELKKFFTIQKDFVFRLLDSMGVKLTKAERDAIQEVPTESMVAFLSYCRGLEYRSQGRLDEAKAEFESAVEYDKDFSEAQDAADAVTEVQSQVTNPTTTEQIEGMPGFADVDTDTQQSSTLTGSVNEAGNMPTTDEDLGGSNGLSSGESDITGPDVPPVVTKTGTIVVKGNLDGN